MSFCRVAQNVLCLMAKNLAISREGWQIQGNLSNKILGLSGQKYVKYHFKIFKSYKKKV